MRRRASAFVHSMNCGGKEQLVLVSKWAFVLAAPHSGSGKTTVTLSILAALRRRGLKVQPFKVGPDFIDPGLHRRVTGEISRNLDGWMLSRETNWAIFRRWIAAADGAVVEGVMGLFDGYDGTTEAGSTAEMAKWLNIPVVLVVDARSMARSVAALVQGFCFFDPDLRCAGVLFNRVGSDAHLAFLREAMTAHLPHIPVLGGFPREESLRLPERHLGLVTAEESPFDAKDLDRLAHFAETHMDLDQLLQVTQVTLNEHRAPSKTKAPWPDFVVPATAASSLWLQGSDKTLKCTTQESRLVAQADTQSGLWKSRKPVIAVARDAVFCFYYQDNLDLLEAYGARLRFFSPLAGETVPDDAAALYLGGGYPEEHAKILRRNDRFFADVQKFAQSARPVYAECGGLMVLSRHITLVSGERVPMAGILPFGTRMLSRRKALGYVEVVLTRPCLLGEPGRHVRGHEFHYSEIDDAEGWQGAYSYCYRLRARKYRKEQDEGYQVGSVLASYVHLHWGSAPQAAACFVAAAAKAFCS